ncbi:aldose epimerase family protein [Carboxylicivirga sp. M1479]|uniref:aldose epimerase family protein n=1 Tax=Carboxylicivirga sp. M1479 TaxID=2594476 RepID=UPI00117794E4|nr:aldose epimerase family protein [Carboxylicivirga sp. M1479]TRX70294.1 galactose mutarotase [Carboxylicivirga sp. M1479]
MIINQNKKFIPELNQDIEIVTLQNRKHTQVTITNYGGIIMSIKTPDRRGNFAEIALGFDEVEDYLTKEYQNNCPYFGAAIGRYANRIKGGLFSIDDKEYTLNCNNGPNSLHGGPKGFHQKVWDMETFKEPKRTGVILRLQSDDMEEGFPGLLNVKLTYTLTFDNELVIDYEAETTKKTVVNLTNHSYFNLSNMQTPVLKHQMVLYADRFTPKDENDIPTGEIVSVNDSPLDFLLPRYIGDRISDVDGRGYDHNFVINGFPGDLNLGARIIDESTGRSLEFYTTEPGFQVYTGNYLDGSFKRDDVAFTENYGICFEAQKFPDSPNQTHFPSPVLSPGEKYKQTTLYKFGLTE